MKLRRSMMFVPGNNPGMIKDAGIYGADSIMFDLEDSVAYTEKDTARFLVYNALTTLDYGDTEIVVRINDLSTGIGIQDLEAIVRAQPDVIRLPKTETAQDVIDCVADVLEVSSEDILSKSRKADVANARRIAIYVCANELKASNATICEEFGGIGSTSVTNAKKSIADKLKEDDELAADVEDVKAALKGLENSLNR